MKYKLLLLFIFTSQIFFSQNSYKEISYNELKEFKIDENRFEFGWLENAFDKIPCFRDYTKNKMTMQIKDQKTQTVIYKSKENKKESLKIYPKSILIDKINKKIWIKGEIKGGWKSVIPSEFEIYIGKRNDTISNINLSPNLHMKKIFYNGKEVTESIVVDRVPAFYLSQFKKFSAFRSEENIAFSNYKKMNFDIETNFDENSILVFGLSSTYAEIFEIGKLLKQ